VKSFSQPVVQDKPMKFKASLPKFCRQAKVYKQADDEAVLAHEKEKESMTWEQPASLNWNCFADQ
jgi:hypothetical protein